MVVDVIDHFLIDKIMPHLEYTMIDSSVLSLLYYWHIVYHRYSVVITCIFQFTFSSLLIIISENRISADPEVPPA